MRVIEHINDLKAIVKSQKKLGKTIGLVPTMGYLHQGHMSLAASSVSDNDFTVMSIFVNPKQFGVNEDFDRYPKDLESDSSLAEKAGIDIIFVPTVSEMYPEGYSTYINVEGITDNLCGKSRPGHFRGVTTVVAKLFNIVQPDKAYFGQKDAQQVAVIKKMAADLNINIEIITCRIVREADGLALSSRNVYLSTEERKSALSLSKALFETEELIKNGERRKEFITHNIEKKFIEDKNLKIDYIEVVNAETLENVSKIEGKLLIALAVFVGKTRLIDNIVLEV